MRLSNNPLQKFILSIFPFILMMLVSLAILLGVTWANEKFLLRTKLSGEQSAFTEEFIKQNYPEERWCEISGGITLLTKGTDELGLTFFIKDKEDETARYYEASLELDGEDDFYNVRGVGFKAAGSFGVTRSDENSYRMSLSNIQTINRMEPHLEPSGPCFLDTRVESLVSSQDIKTTEWTTFTEDEKLYAYRQTTVSGYGGINYQFAKVAIKDGGGFLRKPKVTVGHRMDERTVDTLSYRTVQEAFLNATLSF